MSATMVDKRKKAQVSYDLKKAEISLEPKGFGGKFLSVFSNFLNFSIYNESWHMKFY